MASNRSLRFTPLKAEASASSAEPAFALIHHEQNTDRIYCLNAAAEQAGLHREMNFSDARAFCPELITRPADLLADELFMHALARWSRQYAPWVGLEGRNGLLLDITGCAHLFGGEEKMLTQIQRRFTKAKLQVQVGIADTIGAAWAISHYAAKDQIAPTGETLDAVKELPIVSLRLPEKDTISLKRLGVNTIEQLLALPRKNINRRFNPNVLEQLDKTMGWQSEQIVPVGDPPHFGVRMNLPDPIGLQSDVMAGLERLLGQLVIKLKRYEYGARHLRLIVRRVDQEHGIADLKLARPMRDPERLLKLFERAVGELDAGYGIDQMQLRAVEAELLPVEQIGDHNTPSADALDDLVSRIGSRIGIENIMRFLPCATHIPERSFSLSPAAWSQPVSKWPNTPPRPLQIFPPEPIEGRDRTPPKSFKWRRMGLAVQKTIGPERITPEWWSLDDNWRRGLRDYWRVETKQGYRLWLFYTPQSPGWFVQGEFA